MTNTTDDPRVVLITGAGRGIGAATAILAGARGYHLCVNYRADRTSADRVVAGIRDEGGLWTALVNNAGILERQI